MKVKGILLCVSCFLFTQVGHAEEIYKCMIDGKLAFSDQPCSDNPDRIKIDVQKASDAEAKNQQEQNQNIESLSKEMEIDALEEENEQLLDEIARLRAERESVLQEIGKDIYTDENGRVISPEVGVFSKLRETSDGYKQKINDIKQQIDQNKLTIHSLSQ